MNRDSRRATKLRTWGSDPRDGLTTLPGVCRPGFDGDSVVWSPGHPVAAKTLLISSAFGARVGERGVLCRQLCLRVTTTGSANRCAPLRSPDRALLDDAQPVVGPYVVDLVDGRRLLPQPGWAAGATGSTSGQPGRHRGGDRAPLRLGSRRPVDRPADHSHPAGGSGAHRCPGGRPGGAGQGSRRLVRQRRADRAHSHA